jgi:hypothetical protein
MRYTERSVGRCDEYFGQPLAKLGVGPQPLDQLTALSSALIEVPPTPRAATVEDSAVAKPGLRPFELGAGLHSGISVITIM